MKVLVLNGPNLHLLGQREPSIYGYETLADIETLVERVADDLGVTIECRQSNHEGELVEWIGDARADCDGIVINPAAYTHTSVAIRDAVAASGLPVVELHISNVSARESFRRTSFIAPVCLGMLSGFGVRGYEWAVRALVEHLRRTSKGKTV
ncbi:MAG: type II 3-dehydroquinate dehydratase [Candidatus Pacebacteria bacterium]|nr:type II 3-dehydroquinate dehydratase [Candidatus Paceibacterota bacterium]